MKETIVAVLIGLIIGGAGIVAFNQAIGSRSDQINQLNNELNDQSDEVIQQLEVLIQALKKAG